MREDDAFFAARHFHSQDFRVEVVGMEMAGQEIDPFAGRAERLGHDAIGGIPPKVENEDGIRSFEHETAMENVGECHGHRFTGKFSFFRGKSKESVCAG